MKLRVQLPRSRVPERRYTIRVVLEDFLGQTAVEIQEEDRADTCISIPGIPGAVHLAEGLFAETDERWLQPGSLPGEHLPSRDPGEIPFPVPALTGPLPLLYGPPASKLPWVRREADRIHLHFDLAGSIFFLLSGYETLASPVRDAHGRFPARASVLHRLDCLHRPLVDEYVALLRAAMDTLWPDLLPPPPAYRFRLTHDVDVPYLVRSRPRRRVLLEAGADVLKRRDPAMSVRRLKAIGYGPACKVARDPGWTFPFILDTCEQAGVEAEFNFMAAASDPHYDMGYRLDDPPIRDLLVSLRTRGFGIGFHPSYQTCEDPERLQAEWRTLREAVQTTTGRPPDPVGRQHFLRWSHPATWRHWSQAGLERDGTLGFADAVGFRCGTCTPFRVFDLEHRAPLDLVEEPLLAMDTTLFKYQQLDETAALQTVVDLAGTCRRFGGVFSLLWHNHNLVAPHRRLLYRAMLEAAT